MENSTGKAPAFQATQCLLCWKTFVRVHHRAKGIFLSFFLPLLSILPIGKNAMLLIKRGMKELKKLFFFWFVYTGSVDWDNNPRAALDSLNAFLWFLRQAGEHSSIRRNRKLNSFEASSVQWMKMRKKRKKTLSESNPRTL
jgi:hypothetical protein